MCVEELNTYKPTYAQEGNDAGRIQNTDKAQELAHLENAKREADAPVDSYAKNLQPAKPEASEALGKAMDTIESGWKQEDAREGLTEKEVENVKFMEGLASNEKYANAFVEKQDGKGNKFLVLHPIDVDDLRSSPDNINLRAGRVIFMCKRGVFEADTFKKLASDGKAEDLVDNVSWDKVEELLENDEVNVIKRRELLFMIGEQKHLVNYRKLDLNNYMDRDNFKLHVEFSEKLGKEMKEDLKSKPDIDAAELLKYF